MIAATLVGTAPLLGCSDYWEPPAQRTYVFDPMAGSILGASGVHDPGADSLQSDTPEVTEEAVPIARSRFPIP